MREPLWWIWLCVFADIFVHGNDYYGIPTWRWGSAWFVATEIARTCGEIRRGE